MNVAIKFGDLYIEQRINGDYTIVRDESEIATAPDLAGLVSFLMDHMGERDFKRAFGAHLLNHMCMVWDRMVDEVIQRR